MRDTPVPPQMEQEGIQLDHEMVSDIHRYSNSYVNLTLMEQTTFSD